MRTEVSELMKKNNEYANMKTNITTPVQLHRFQFVFFSQCRKCVHIFTLHKNGL